MPASCSRDTIERNARAQTKLIDDPLKTHKLAIEIESAIPHIHRYWAPKRKSAVEQVQRDAPKTGRNEPCPCGSGKKYKQCCLARTH